MEAAAAAVYSQARSPIAAKRGSGAPGTRGISPPSAA